jgi:acyl-CoA thioesterase-1
VIVAFGDSLTAGYGITPGRGYPERLQELLDMDGHAYRVVNAGVSGDTTAGGLGRVQNIRKQNPKIVILELGANDGLQGLPIVSMRANLEEMIMTFQQDGAAVVLAGMTLPRNLGSAYISQFDQVFVELARKYDLVLIPFFLEGAIGREGLMLEDGIHPNERGYDVIAAAVFKFIKPLLSPQAQEGKP